MCKVFRSPTALDTNRYWHACKRVWPGDEGPARQLKGEEITLDVARNVLLSFVSGTLEAVTVGGSVAGRVVAGLGGATVVTWPASLGLNALIWTMNAKEGYCSIKCTKRQPKRPRSLTASAIQICTCSADSQGRKQADQVSTPAVVLWSLFCMRGSCGQHYLPWLVMVEPDVRAIPAFVGLYAAS